MCKFRELAGCSKQDELWVCSLAPRKHVTCWLGVLWTYCHMDLGTKKPPFASLGNPKQSITIIGTYWYYVYIYAVVLLLLHFFYLFLGSMFGTIFWRCRRSSSALQLQFAGDSPDAEYVMASVHDSRFCKFLQYERHHSISYLRTRLLVWLCFLMHRHTGRVLCTSCSGYSGGWLWFRGPFQSVVPWVLNVHWTIEPLFPKIVDTSCCDYC